MEKDVPINSHDINRHTLDSYDAAADLYNQRTPAAVEGFIKEWIDSALALLPPGASILEIGTGTGRDAHYIEQSGFDVVRTEASVGLMKLLHTQGITIYKLNVVTDELTERFTMIYANAVFHHFPEDVLSHVLRKVHRWLLPGGLFACSVKEGNGEVWETAKLEHPRYFRYWASADFIHQLTTTGFHILHMKEGLHSEQGDSWITILATKQRTGSEAIPCVRGIKPRGPAFH